MWRHLQEAAGKLLATILSRIVPVPNIARHCSYDGQGSPANIESPFGRQLVLEGGSAGMPLRAIKWRLIVEMAQSAITVRTIEMGHDTSGKPPCLFLRVVYEPFWVFLHCRLCDSVMHAGPRSSRLPRDTSDLYIMPRQMGIQPRYHVKSAPSEELLDRQIMRRPFVKKWPGLENLEAGTGK